MASETVKVFKADQDQEEDVVPEEDASMQSAHEKIVHHLMTTVAIPERVDHVKILVSELQVNTLFFLLQIFAINPNFQTFSTCSTFKIIKKILEANHS